MSEMFAVRNVDEKTKKKYKSFFDLYDKLKFKSDDPHLSERIDDILYGGED